MYISFRFFVTVSSNHSKPSQEDVIPACVVSVFHTYDMANVRSPWLGHRTVRVLSVLTFDIGVNLRVYYQTFKRTLHGYLLSSSYK